MPRIQFHWHNIQCDLREIIAAKASMPADTPEAFVKRFGKRPDEDFVKECWPALFEFWLSCEDADAMACAHLLSAAGYGNRHIQHTCDYILSCVTAPGFHSIILQVFLAKGQQPRDGVRLPATLHAHHIAEAPPHHAALSTHPPLPQLRRSVAGMLQQHYAPAQLSETPDGELLIVAGSCTVRITVQAPPLIVRVHAALVTGVVVSDALLESLNSINSVLPLGRIFYQDETVYLESSLLDATFTETAVMTAVKNIAYIADFYDDRLQHAFGGKRMRDGLSADHIDV